EISPVETLPGAIRGGFLEFKLILDRERLRGNREEFLKDLQAEGVQATADRYGSLYRLSVFRKGGSLTLRLLEPTEPTSEPSEVLPQTESLQGRIVTLPSYTNVPPGYVRQVAGAIRKVARHWAR